MASVSPIAAADGVLAVDMFGHVRNHAPPAGRQRWRLFFMACKALFGYRGGKDWLVAQARMKPGTAG